ncbi:MAG: CBS domain-containing protein [Alphaproteobacteria bacterium]
MKVKAMLSAKESKIVTARPDETVATAIDLLNRERIGALVVSDDGDRIQGILSERDIVRALLEHGGDLMEMPVSELMTRTVKTCTLDANIHDVMSEMTRSRIRHLPVLDGDKLCGMISIGDVVKNRLDELETETTELREYISGRS